jgi:1,4-dihydroxy-2-naphthoyl-CoA hydrolase
MSDEPSSRRTPESFNSAGVRKLPGHLGIVITEVSDTRVAGELPVVESVMAPNGYLHAGTIVTLADTVAGYGCVANLPAEATGFTTIELKSNHLGTARDGTIVGVATPVHRGRTTQVWDAVVVHKESGRTLAVFRCTQMILYTKQKTASELP